MSMRTAGFSLILRSSSWSCTSGCAPGARSSFCACFRRSSASDFCGLPIVGSAVSSGGAPGQTALLFVAFSPAFLPLSAEVRGYSLLLFLWRRRACRVRGRARSAIPGQDGRILPSPLSGDPGSLCGALHHDSLFVYALVRFWKDRPPRRVLRIWAVSQAGAAALYLFLYFTQVAALRGTEAVQTLTGPFASSYFHPDRETASAFLVRQTAAVFRYLFGSRFAAAVDGCSRRGRSGLSLAQAEALRRPARSSLRAGSGLRLDGPVSVRRDPALRLRSSLRRRGRRGRGLGVREPISGSCCPESLCSLCSGESRIGRRRLGASLRRRPRSTIFGASPREGACCGLTARRDLSFAIISIPAGSSAGPTREYRLVRSAFWAPGPERLGEELKRLIRNYRLSAGKRFWMIRLGVDEASSRNWPGRFRPPYSQLSDDSATSSSSKSGFGTLPPHRRAHVTRPSRRPWARRSSRGTLPRCSPMNQARHE